MIFNYTPWLHIILAVGVYIGTALLASYLIKKEGTELKEMKDRSSRFVIMIGAVSNTLVTIFILVFLIALDHRQITSLGTEWSGNDRSYSVMGVVVIVSAAFLFVWIAGLSRQYHVTFKAPFQDRSGATGFGMVFGVLFIVAVQEEVLFRGYLTLNLLQYGSAAIIIISSLIFASIHLITNRSNIYQKVSWFLVGVVLSYIYLVTGTIWIPIIIHFVIDMTNVAVFDIVGENSAVTISPPLSERDRFLFRLGTSAILAALLMVVYSPGIKMP